MKNVRKRSDYPGVYAREIIDSGTKRKIDTAWYISYRLRQSDGTWRQYNELAGRSKRDGMSAKQASDERSDRMRGKTLPNRQRRREATRVTWTVGALWNEYRLANPGLKSWKDYASIYSKYIAPRFSNKLPQTILARDIDQLTRDELRGKSPQTVAHVLELLRRLCNFGKKRGLSPGLSFQLELPKLHNEKTEDLTSEQMHDLLEVINDKIEHRAPSRWGAYVMKFALFTGMRKSEILNLQWKDIDEHRKNIHIRDAKSGRDEVVPLSSFTEQLLETIKEMEQVRSTYVIPGKGGDRRRTDIRNPVNAIKNEARLPSDFRGIHGLRHVFASGLVSAGVDFQIIQRLLCHKGATVTHRYSHIRDDALRAAAELAGENVVKAS